MVKVPSTPLEQTARMLDLVPFLLTHQGIALNDLADHFKVDTEIMLDDLNTLWMCGLPGYTPLELIDLNFDSGFVSIRNAAPLAYIRTMSSSEIVALVLGLDLLLDDSVQISPENRKRIEVLSKKLRREIGTNVEISLSSPAPFRSVIESAIASRKSVEMTYFSPTSDQSTERIVSPYHFFQEGEYEYFEAFCDTSHGMRTFRVDRIVSAAICDLVKSVSDAGLTEGASIRIQARIQSPDRHTAETFGLSYSSLEDGQSIEISAFSQEWLSRAIIAGGGTVSAQSPLDIREKIRLTAEDALALYE
jgi:proteasome accessory factor C